MNKNNIIKIVMAFLGVLWGIIIIIVPSQDIIYLENRKATALPQLTFEAMATGEYGKELEKYVSDRLPVRSQLIAMKCFINQCIFCKTEENDILIGKEGYLFAKHFGTEDTKQLYKNIEAIDTFAKNTTVPVYVMIAPSSDNILTDKLPSYAPVTRNIDILQGINDRLEESCKVIKLHKVLEQHSEEYIYYRTDHHWTMLGAYLAYEEYCRVADKVVYTRDWDKTVLVDDFYGTYYAKTRYYKAVPDAITYFPSDNSLIINKVIGDARYQPMPQEALVNVDKLKGYDKYGAFINGNNGYSVIEGDGEGSILIVKDSYANCYATLLIHNYSRIGIIDYRNYAYGLESLIKAEGYEEVLILYSYDMLMEDKKLTYINRPAINN